MKKSDAKNIVLFIHGFNSNNSTWNNSSGKSFVDLLLEDGELSAQFDFAHITYFTELVQLGVVNNLRKKRIKGMHLVGKNNSISELAEYVHSTIDLNCEEYENIVIVAHSMGGLIAKSYILKELKHNSTSKVKLLLSMAVPHNGSEWATLGKALSKNEQIIDLAPLSPVLSELNNQWIQNDHLLPEVVYFYGQIDQIVSKTSAIGLQATRQNIVACRDDHFSIVKPETITGNAFLGVKKSLKRFSSVLTEERLIQDKSLLNLVDVNVIDHPLEIENFRRIWFHASTEEIIKRYQFPLLDIKLLNNSDSPVYIYKIEFRTNVINFKFNEKLFRAMPVSWDYTILFDPSNKEDVVHLEVSQLINSKDGDRFVITIGQENNYGRYEEVQYEVEIILHYNGREEFSLGKYNIKVMPPIMLDNQGAREIEVIK